MNAQQLKNAILQIAMEGHLVQQKEQDTPFGETLLNLDLSQETKKKKRGRPTDLSCIGEEDAPFSIPSSWKWCRISDISSSYIGLTYKPVDINENGTIILRSSNIRDGKLILDDIVRVSTSIPDKLYVQDGDILICSRNGSKKLVGKSAIIKGLTEPVSFGAFMAICRTLFTKYVYYFLQSDLFFSQLREVSDTTTINQLTQKSFNSFMIPMPPVEEQERIVAKLEEILPIVTSFGKSQEELDRLNKILPDKLCKSVLQEAIHGNLVSNDIPDGEATAPELLQQILEERQDRENKAKGKKAKKLALSTIDEEPWELPEGWCWTKIGDVFDHSAGKSLNSSKQSIGKVYPYLTTSNVYWEGINFDKVKEMAFTEEEYEKCSAIKNDILVCEGGDVGRSCIWTFEYSIGLQNHVHRLRAVKNTDVKYFNYVLRFYKSAGIITAKGIGIGGFSANALKGLSVPLPPLSIQHRIVEKIEEVFAAIDQLQA